MAEVELVDVHDDVSSARSPLSAVWKYIAGDAVEAGETDVVRVKIHGLPLGCPEDGGSRLLPPDDDGGNASKEGEQEATAAGEGARERHAGWCAGRPASKGGV